MSGERFSELVADAILSLPQDVKAVLRIVEDPEIDDEGRVAAAGALVHVLSGSNAIPGMRGIMGFVDDVLVLRLVLEQLAKTNPDAFARHREESPDLIQPLDEHLAIVRAYLGDLMSVLEEAAAQVGKLSHQGHNAKACGTDEAEATWLYDAMHEAIVNQLEFDEDEVLREMKSVDRILPALRTRTGTRA